MTIPDLHHQHDHTCGDRIADGTESWPLLPPRPHRPQVNPARDCDRNHGLLTDHPLDSVDHSRTGISITSLPRSLT